PQEAGAHVITVRNRFPLHRFVGPLLSTAPEPAECISHIGHPPAPEDGTLKRTLALVLGLAAVLLFAPVARADFHGGKSPYRDAASLGPARRDCGRRRLDGVRAPAPQDAGSVEPSFGSPVPGLPGGGLSDF